MVAGRKMNTKLDIYYEDEVPGQRRNSSIRGLACLGEQYNLRRQL